jgi:hypothetical protein
LQIRQPRELGVELPDGRIDHRRRKAGHHGDVRLDRFKRASLPVPLRNEELATGVDACDD